MLTAAQERYIDWYFAHADGKLTREIAAEAGVELRSVERGLQWCRKRNIDGHRNDRAELEKRCVDLQHDIKQTEGDIRRVKRHLRDYRPTSAGDGPYLGLNNSLIGFRRLLTDQKHQLAELQGLLKRVLELGGGRDDEDLTLTIEVVKRHDAAGQ